jgi:hypothetical protein
MSFPDWRDLASDEGILVELSPEPGRLILWLLGLLGRDW